MIAAAIGCLPTSIADAPVLVATESQYDSGHPSTDLAVVCSNCHKMIHRKAKLARCPGAESNHRHPDFQSVRPALLEPYGVCKRPFSIGSVANRLRLSPLEFAPS